MSLTPHEVRSLYSISYLLRTLGLRVLLCYVARDHRQGAVATCRLSRYTK
jgi:hypothetical protein